MRGRAVPVPVQHISCRPLLCNHTRLYALISIQCLAITSNCTKSHILTFVRITSQQIAFNCIYSHSVASCGSNHMVAWGNSFLPRYECGKMNVSPILSRGFSMARKNLVDRLILAEQELEAAKAKFVKLQKESADRIARLALKSGLPTLGLTDDQIKAEFDSIVAKHRKGGTS